jgi:hypothetical protein
MADERLTRTVGEVQADVGGHRAAIEDLMYAYCEYVDAGDLDRWSALFRHGRYIAVDGQVYEGPEEARRYQESTFESVDRPPPMVHLITNLRIHFDLSKGTASATSSVVVFQADDSFPLQAIYVGRYQDDLRLIEDIWWFEERRAVTVLRGDMSRRNKLDR